MWVFMSAPKVGGEFKWRKRTFRCVGAQEKQDGAWVIDWKSRCPLCKEEYGFRTYTAAVTPRSICPDCLAKPRAARVDARVATTRVPKRKPGVEEIVFGVGELPWEVTASLARNTVSWAPKMLKKYSTRLRHYTTAEINAGLSDALAAGRVRHEVIGWNKWRRPMYGLRAYGAAEVLERQRVNRARSETGESLFD